jgi:hypothetical protein
MPPGIRRPDLHARAARLAHAACAKYGAALPDDLREVLQYWQASELAFERAAEHVIAYAAALGIAEPADPATFPRSTK